MRIIIAHNYSPTSFSVISWSLARHLAAQGHEVLFFSHQPNLETPDTSVKGLTVVGWPEERPTGFLSFRYYYKRHKAFHPELVILHFAPQYVAGIAAWLLNCPHIWGYYHTAEEANIADTQQTGFMSRVRRSRKSWLYSLFDRVICVSRFASQDIQRFFSVPGNKLETVYNALPDRWNGAYKKPATDPVVFHLLARLDPCKRTIELAKAFMAFTQRTGCNAVLKIAGDGSLKNELKNSIRTAANVNYEGPIPYSEVDRFIGSAHYMLCPSLVETFGMVNAEALMNATPVLASNSGGIPEVVLDGKTGFLSNGLDEESWISLFDKAYKLVTEQPDRYVALQKNCRQLYEEKFTINHYLQQMDEKISSLQTS